MADFNYRESGAPKLTDEFKSKFIVNIKGKEAVLAEGIKVLAHEKGIKKLNTRIVQFPNKDNDNMCIVEAHLVGYDWDPIEKKVTEVEYVAIGDASPRNCTSMVAAAFIRMAETRAISRVLKNYTNIGMVAFEELSSATEEIVEMINANQINEIAALMKQRSITKEVGRQMMIETCGKDNLRGLTAEDAVKLITKMKVYTPQEAV